MYFSLQFCEFALLVFGVLYHYQSGMSGLQVSSAGGAATHTGWDLTADLATLLVFSHNIEEDTVSSPESRNCSVM
jgi:hypothetical protein